MTATSKKAFLDKLKSVCKNCKKVSLNIYHTNIKRLYRFVNPDADSVPITKSWLMSENLFKKYKSFPVNVRRHLSTAAVKAGQAYGLKKENKWFAAMIQDQNAYQKNRNKNKLSDKEKDLIPKAGLKAIKRSAYELKKRIKYVLSEEPTLSNLYKYQWFIALKLFSEIPLRNDYPTISITGTEGNHLVRPKKGNYKFVLKNYKNSDRLGEREIKISRAGTMALKKFLTFRSKIDMDHNKLFTAKSGKKLTKASFGKGLQSTTSKLLGKPIGSRIIRILHATANKKVIEQAAELTNKLLHTAKQTKQYVKE